MVRHLKIPRTISKISFFPQINNENKSVFFQNVFNQYLSCDLFTSSCLPLLSIWRFSSFVVGVCLETKLVVQFMRERHGQPSTPERAGSAWGSLGAGANGLHGAGIRSHRQRSSVGLALPRGKCRWTDLGRPRNNKRQNRLIFIIYEPRTRARDHHLMVQRYITPFHLHILSRWSVQRWAYVVWTCFSVNFAIIFLDSSANCRSPTLDLSVNLRWLVAQGSTHAGIPARRPGFRFRSRTPRCKNHRGWCQQTVAELGPARDRSAYRRQRPRTRRRQGSKNRRRRIR